MIIKTRRLLVFLGLVFMIPLSVGLVMLQTRWGSRASGGEVRLSFVPGTDLVLRANTGQYKAGFLKVEWTFDPNKIRLGSEITTTNSLRTIVQKTTMAQANANGRVSVVLGLAPTDLLSAPSSDFEVARMQIEILSNTPNDRADLIFDSNNLQVVDDTGTAMVVIPTNSGYDLNVTTPTVTDVVRETTVPTIGPDLPTDPTVTPLPSAEPTIAPTLIPEPTAVPTATPTHTPVPTVVPTSTPLPTAVPTVVPTAVPSVTPTRAPVATVTTAPNLPTIAATPLPTVTRPTSTIVPTPTRAPGKKICAEGDFGSILANYKKTKDLGTLIVEFYLLISKGRCK